MNVTVSLPIEDWSTILDIVINDIEMLEVGMRDPDNTPDYNRELLHYKVALESIVIRVERALGELKILGPRKPPIRITQRKS